LKSSFSFAINLFLPKFGFGDNVVRKSLQFYDFFAVEELLAGGANGDDRNAPALRP
jgi:hypothetical protein